MWRGPTPSRCSQPTYIGHAMPHATSEQKILSTIPDNIGDRPKFLGMIRDIASAIKDLLDAFNEATTKNAAILDKRKSELEAHKREFVRTSKNFSDTLKKFFKDGK